MEFFKIKKLNVKYFHYNLNPFSNQYCIIVTELFLSQNKSFLLLFIEWISDPNKYVYNL